MKNIKKEMRRYELILQAIARKKKTRIDILPDSNGEKTNDLPQQSVIKIRANLYAKDLLKASETDISTLGIFASYRGP